MLTTKDWPINIGGIDHIVASDDTYLEGYRDGFEPEMVRLFRAVINPQDVVFDIGANVGCTALLFGGSARSVYAYEPSRSTYAFLEKNMARSGLQNVVVRNVGLGARRDSLTLTFAPANRSGGFVSNQITASAGHTVEHIDICTLDEETSTLGIEKIDFIKIDVEGFERDVLRGGAASLLKFRPVVVLELNHWCLNAFQRISIPDFFDFLRNTFPILLAVDGRSYLNLHDDSESYMVMYHHILHMKFPNIVAAFDERKLEGFRSQYQHQFIA